MSRSLTARAEAKGPALPGKYTSARGQGSAEGPGGVQAPHGVGVGEVPEPAAQRANPRVGGAGDCRWGLRGSLRSRPLTPSPSVEAAP